MNTLVNGVRERSIISGSQFLNIIYFDKHSDLQIEEVSIGQCFVAMNMTRDVSYSLFNRTFTALFSALQHPI